MKALQLHYTSCRRGRSGNAGFQTRAMSPGILPDEQREIERKGGYRPPRDFDPEPSADTIASQFPRALRTYALANGKLVVSMANYSGRDYSGRWGNFFSHNLLFESALDGLWPIDLYEWPGWVTSLPAEQDTEDSPPDLPAVDLTGLRPAESFQAAELAEFLREETGRVEALAKMTRALFLSLDDARPVVLRDNPTEALYRLACLQKVLPPELAWTISWSTYQDDPRGCAQVNATVGETDFSFSEAEGRFRFYLFDVLGGLESEVAGNAEDYPRLAAGWLADSPAKLDELFRFLTKFTGIRRANDLLAAAHLLELTGNPQWRGLSSQRLSAMIELVATRSLPAARKELLRTLVGAASIGCGELSPSDSLRLIELLLDTQGTDQAETFPAVERVFLAMLSETLLKRKQGLGEVLAAWRRLGTTPAALQRSLGAGLLGAPFWNSIGTQTEQVLQALWQVAWDSLTWSPKARPTEELPIRKLSEALIGSSSDLAATVAVALATMPVRADELASAAYQFQELWTSSTGKGHRGDQFEIGRGLGSALRSLPGDVARAIRLRLEVAQADALLFGEWRVLREQAADPVVAFAEYERQILPSIPTFAKRALDQIAQDALDSLPTQMQREAALSWLNDGRIRAFADPLAGRCLGLANDALSIEKTKVDAVVTEALTEEANRRGIKLYPDRPFLRRILAGARKANNLPVAADLVKVGDAIQGLTTAEYEHFLANFLHPLLPLAENVKAHSQLLGASFRAANVEAFSRTYSRFLAGRCKKPWSESAVSALRFWLEFEQGKQVASGLSRLQGAAYEALITALSKLDAEDLEGLERQIFKGRAGATSRHEWEELRRRAERKRDTWWRRAFARLWPKERSNRR